MVGWKVEFAEYNSQCSCQGLEIDKQSSFREKDKDKDLMSKDKDKDEDLKIGSSRTRTFLEDNNTVNLLTYLALRSSGL